MRDSLLMLSQCLPYPPHSGVANRTFNILVQLQRAFDVHLVAFSRRNHQPDAAARADARDRLAQLVTAVYEPAPIASERSGLTRTINHLRSVVTFRPYTLYDYRSVLFSRALAEIQMAKPVMVHMDSLDLYGWISRLPGVPLAVTHHSVESDLLRSRARRMALPPVRAYVRYQAALMEAVEQRVCREVDLNVMMSDIDADKLRALVPGVRTTIVPNGVDITYFSPREGPGELGRVLFLGPTYMYPNRDAIEWFIASMWEAVCAAVPGARLHLVGKNTPGDRKRFENCQAVQCHGYVTDVRPHLAAAACSVVPIRVGGGTRLKILDAWAAGTPVVSTSVGCEGLAVEDGTNILVRDDPDAFASAVIQVLRDPGLQLRLAAAGRRTVEQLYSWSAIGDRLIEAYQKLLAEKRCGASGSRIA